MRWLLLCTLFITVNVFAQPNLIYQNLPVGKYAVGYKVFTLTDPSRIAKPDFNYLGEKTTGDRRKKITVHLWYPAATKAGRSLVYGDYCYSHLLHSTNEILSSEKKAAAIQGAQQSVERWFGKTTDGAWGKLVKTTMLALEGAAPSKEKFPLLIGVLRPLSTTVTNEMLASNGYVVAMITDNNASSFAEAALLEIPDMQFALVALEKSANIDSDKIGTFGFSGSGFSQVSFAMSDYRIKAVADIESGIYMDVLFQAFSASNYYQPSKLRAPFLHIFSRDLSKQEKFIDEFEHKAKFANRYRLLLNQPALHHWDFATEGYTACTSLNMRGKAQKNIQQSFEIANYYLLNFFNAELKSNTAGKSFLSSKPSLNNTPDSLWSITFLHSVKPAPTKDELEYIVRTKGVEQAVTIVKNTIQQDSSTDILQGYTLNNLGYAFVSEKKYKEALGIFRLNADMHPGDPNLMDSLAEIYELTGDQENMKQVTGMVIALLNKKESLTDQEKGLKVNAEKRLQSK